MIRPKPKAYFTAGGLMIIIALAALRFLNLGADPPDIFMDMGESLLTDPYYYTYFARNAVLFGDWHLYDTEAFNIFRNSLISGTAFGFFSLFGVSRITAHLASLILNLGGLALFVMSVYDRRRPAVSLFVAFFLLSNVMLFFYGRFPLLENGLIFLAGTASFIFFKYGHSLSGAFSTGAVIALATLAGKLFGIVLLPAAVLSIFLAGGGWRRAGMVVIGFSFSAIVYLTIVSDGSPDTFFEYLATVSGNIGYPVGLQSISALARAFLSYLSLPGLLGFNSIIIILAIASMIILFATDSSDNNSAEYRMLLFCTVWILAAILILSPHEYRPSRYGLYLFMPFSMLAGLFCRRIMNCELKFRHRAAFFHWPVLFIAFSLLVSCFFALTANVGEMVGRVAENVLMILMLATACTIVLYVVRGKMTLRSGFIRYSIVVLLFLVTAVQSAYVIAEGMSAPRYHLREANRTLSQLVGSNAVITGNYAPALTIDNNIKGVAHFFADKKYDKKLFERFPITHLAIAPVLQPGIEQQYNLENSLVPIFSTSIRGASMKVLRLENRGYDKSGYERAVDALYDQDLVTANRLMNSLMSDYPLNPAVRLLRLEILIARGEFEIALTAIDKFASDHSKNYDLQVMSAMLSARCYHASGNRSALERVSFYHSRAKELHPRLATTVDELFAVTRMR